MATPALVLTPYDRAEAETKQAVALCGGDAMEALRVALAANAFLETQVDELAQQVSAGYTRRNPQRG